LKYDNKNLFHENKSLKQTIVLLQAKFSNESDLKNLIKEALESKFSQSFLDNHNLLSLNLKELLQLKELSKSHLTIYLHFRDNPKISQNELAAYCQVSTAYINKVVKILLEKRLLVKEGRGKATRYKSIFSSLD